jgi:peptide deformylase
MALLEIKIAPDSVLRTPTQPVTDFNAALHSFLDDMYETMVAANGIGLAAPQVGVLHQVAIIDISGDYISQPTITAAPTLSAADHTHKGRLELINPTITSGSKRVSSDEGCLSIPDFRDSIPRFDSISVTALDRHGRSFSLSAEELLAYAIQHEVDHLHGVLFVDHLSRLKKTFFKKWAIKNLGSADV